MSTISRKVCYCVFDADTTKRYAYLCGSLDPQVGKLVVVETAGGRYKVVQCVALADSDPKATRPLFATLIEQQDYAPSL